MNHEIYKLAELAGSISNKIKDTEKDMIRLQERLEIMQEILDSEARRMERDLKLETWCRELNDPVL